MSTQIPAHYVQQAALYLQATEPRVSMSPADFMAGARVVQLAGNTTWAGQYANELRDIVVTHANGSARNVQRHLGPSEIGHPCHRQVAGKLAQLPPTNHVIDPWASIMGTAGHAWMEECFTARNKALGRVRYLPEFRVTPDLGFGEHPGTGDLYDADIRSVVDWKFLGDTTMNKLRKNGPPRHYLVQMQLYGRGFVALGLQVERLVLVAWPRTTSSLDGMYVYEHQITEADYAFLRDVIEPELRYRKQWAAALVAGQAQLMDVPADTSDCVFCPFFRPQSAKDGGVGCPGHAATQT